MIAVIVPRQRMMPSGVSSCRLTDRYAAVALLAACQSLESDQMVSMLDAKQEAHAAHQEAHAAKQDAHAAHQEAHAACQETHAATANMLMCVLTCMYIIMACRRRADENIWVVVTQENGCMLISCACFANQLALQTSWL